LLSVRDPIRRRQPIERPLDVIGLELLVTITQALLAGILLSLAAQLGGDARAYGLPVPGLLAVLAIVVGVGWLRWLVGGSGVVMAAVGLATALLTGALWLLALQDPSLPRIDWLVGLTGAACAIYGLVAGVFLDGPHRAHWKGGVSQPHRGVPDTRAKPARFSPPVQKVVDERLTNVRLPKVSMPSTARLKAVSMPRPTRGTTVGPERPDDGPSGDGLSVAADVAPHPPVDAREVTTIAAPPDRTTDGMAVEVAPAVGPTPVGAAPVEVARAPVAADPEPSVPAAPAEPSVPASAAPAPSRHDATGVVAPAATEEAAVAPPDPGEGAAHADPDAPTQPIARPAEWPRPIEPRSRTGAHKVDPGP
jgi:hypothetical protein